MRLWPATVAQHCVRQVLAAGMAQLNRHYSLGQFLSSILLLTCPLTLLLLLLNGRSPSGRFWSLDDDQRLSATSAPPSQLPSEAELLATIRNGSVRCGDIQAMFPGRIPPVVHWTNKDGRILHGHQEVVRTWPRVLGDSVAYMYWEDADAERLISRYYPQVWTQYRKLQVGLMRSDIARLAILHHVGGVYTDLDVKLMRSLHPLMLNYTEFWSQEPLEHIYFMYKRNRLLSNAIYLTKARHPFLDYVLKSWPPWFDSVWSKRGHELRDTNKAIYVTGPLMLNNFLDKYENATTNRPVSLADPDQFQHTWDSWYAQNLVRRQCSNQARLPPNHRRQCERLRANRFQQSPMPKDAYGLHKFMHTSYGKTNNYVNSKPASSILPLSRCII